MRFMPGKSGWVVKPWVLLKEGTVVRCSHFESSQDISHRIHVWYIYPHLVYFYGTCIGKDTIHGWYGY